MGKVIGEENKVYSQIRAMVATYLKSSNRFQDVDDIANEIAVAYFDNIQALYDPEKGALSTFVFRYVEKKIKGLVYRKNKHDVKIALEDVAEPSDCGFQMRGIESDLLIEELARSIDTPQLKVFFSLLVDQINEARFNLADVAKEMGISGAGCSFYMKKLQAIPAFREAFAALG